jgi:Protein of unknown function (DUF3592)
MIDTVGSATNPKPASRALALFFLPFLGLGLFFVVMIVRQAIDSAATYAWQPVPCQILESGVRESSYPQPWFAYLRYRTSAGESVRSSRPFRSYRDAVRFTRRWPAGSQATCYLDARDPSAALLERKGSGVVLLLFLPLPLLFVVIGAGGFYNVVFRVKTKPRVQRTPNPVLGRRFAAVSFLLPGLILFLAFLLGPVRHAIAARSWRAQECKILSSEVWKNAITNGSNAYSPRILFSYAVADGEHRSDNYSFFESSASGWARSQRIASRYRVGSTVNCYVNPADPDDATLNRDPSLQWLIGLLPLALIAGGVAFWRSR